MTVHISATPTHLTARIEDDGAAIGATRRRSGLANLRVRAESHGGEFTIDSGSGHGTRLIWMVPM